VGQLRSGGLAPFGNAPDADHCRCGRWRLGISQTDKALVSVAAILLATVPASAPRGPDYLSANARSQPDTCPAGADGLANGRSAAPEWASGAERWPASIGRAMVPPRPARPAEQGRVALAGADPSPAGRSPSGGRSSALAWAAHPAGQARRQDPTGARAGPSTASVEELAATVRFVPVRGRRDSRVFPGNIGVSVRASGPGRQQPPQYRAFLTHVVRSALWQASCCLTLHAPVTGPRQRERCAERRANANPTRSGSASTCPFCRPSDLGQVPIR